MLFENYKTQGQKEKMIIIDFYEILNQPLLQLKYSSFKSIQIYNIITYKHVKINMDDDTYKESMIIPSFGGVEDVSVGRFSCF